MNLFSNAIFFFALFGCNAAQATSWQVKVIDETCTSDMSGDKIYCSSDFIYFNKSEGILKICYGLEGLIDGKERIKVTCHDGWSKVEKNAFDVETGGSSRFYGPSQNISPLSDRKIILTLSWLYYLVGDKKEDLKLCDARATNLCSDGYEEMPNWPVPIELKMKSPFDVRNTDKK